MLFRKLLPSFAVLVLLFARASHAQLGLYGTFNGERVTGFTCQATDGACASPGGVLRPYGGNFGVFYDLKNYGPVRLGADLRGDVFSTNKSAVEYEGGSGINKVYGVLGGVRASVPIPVRFLHPYAEVLAGLARSNADSTFVETIGSGITSQPTNVERYSNYTQVEGLVGLDITILPFFDIRAIELGAGAIFGPKTHSTESIGGGFVFHLPR